MDKIIIEPGDFVKNLAYMGIGMLGVFMIVGIIICATYIIGRATSGPSKKDNNVN